MGANAASELIELARRVPTLIEMHAHDARRHEWLTLEACGVHADFARNLVSPELFLALMDLVHQRDVSGRFRSMFAGDPINVTEQRGVSHVACRGSGTATDRIEAAADERRRAYVLADRIRADAGVDTVVNIGIGGSDLGPRMAVRALRVHHDGPRIRFVSNVDPADLDEALTGCDPHTTVVVISSKTFTTQETISNAERARTWMTNAGVDWRERFHAVTAAPDTAIEWGIDRDRCLVFHESVGGRFSLSSVIGFAVMVAIGPRRFDEFLAGMHEMDDHVVGTRAERNLAVVHGALWYLNSVVHGFDSVAVVPYASDLSMLGGHLGQLLMESNGKRVDVDGRVLDHPSGPVVWGQVGTDGQHAFFQMLHQGSRVIPVEFVSTVAPMGSDPDAHVALISNMIAQSEALAVGRGGVSPHREFPGNRPSTVIMLDRLDPHGLGALVAMYEHSTAVQGWLMGINSFDQFGVELGKEMATEVSRMIGSSASEVATTMTHPLMRWFVERGANL